MERTAGAGWTRLRGGLGAPDRTNLIRIMPAKGVEETARCA